MEDTPRETLPEDARDALVRAHRSYAEAPIRSAAQKERGAVLAELAVAGRAAGWPMRLLAEPCGVSAERLRQLASRHSGEVADAAAALFPPYERPAPARRRPAQHPHLSPAEAEELRGLAALATRRTGSHAADAPEALASERFTAMVREHHARGVIWAEISDATKPWSSWPLSETERQLEPVVRVSGLRQRVSRAARRR
ncbi:hypothetical protein [Nesterenkonia sp. HG001]|uniref:hypothetical protein n=1 Tax=Nesterenkonia sp. HG001 TaxID=2983207 RepID=UPI002AC58EE3|nr:hypothetical protein [Nesterenkonia sp. HG001]MDZ5078296.1 hypothetical protein [Nesterenkonia sp. HG001]